MEGGKMPIFLDTLKERHAEAQKRTQEAQQKLAAAQTEFQTAAQEMAGWQKAVEAETRREQQNSTITAGTSMEAPVIATVIGQVEQHLQGETNKTELIRELLRQHASGITPPELWKALSSKIVHRPYLYSVLKRLKDKDEVCVKRGKYYLKAIPKAEGDQPQLLQ
jgi:hypothetical protein